MASPSEEIRSREQLRERENRPAAEQASVDAARSAGDDDALYGWKRITSHQKDVPYASPGGADSKR